MINKYSLKNSIIYFLKLGTIGFGGSIALAHAMQTDLVEKGKWLTNEEFLRGLTLSQLAPGPLAAQLAIYIGFVKARILGATVAGIAFVLPSFLMVLIISILYSQFSNLVFVRSALHGIGAAVIGIIAVSGYTLTKRNMKQKRLLWFIYAVIFLVTIFTKSTNVLLFIFAGILTMFVYTKETVRIPREWVVIPFFIPSSEFFINIFSVPLVKMFLYFFIAGSIAFGGGLAIVPFLQNGVVNQFHWLTNKQFVDAIAVAMITPGPVVIAATFIGYLAGQIPGAIIATLAIFLPVYFIVIFLTPIFIRHSENPRMIAFIEGVIAAAMASIAGSVILLGLNSINNLYTLCLALLTVISIKFFRIPGIIIILVAGTVSILLKQ
ncbi:MAG: chromate efflux transporter [Patescibacteria group bacterium]|nr:chromate efflux transporter [Patescibacteria group bacterium]MDE2588572.1 chromate efflux transporter [Patescibacteria group bacterium]